MLFTVIYYLFINYSIIVAASDCKDKTEHCINRVQFNVSELVFGLLPDIHQEVYYTFLSASAKCIECFDTTNTILLTITNTPSTMINFQIDVCMDNISPLDTSSSSYNGDYTTMINDFTYQLSECYANSEDFYNSWSSLAAESGIDLYLSTTTSRDSMQRISDPIALSVPFVDTENAKVTTYTSSNTHRSTSNMILYTSVGIAAVSVFAIVNVIVVVNVIKKRTTTEEEKALKWIANMNSADSTIN
jgi:hypothetical protein